MRLLRQAAGSRANASRRSLRENGGGTAGRPLIHGAAKRSGFRAPAEITFRSVNSAAER